MRRLMSYLQFVLLFELNGPLTRVRLQGLILWALLEMVKSLWPRAKLDLNFDLAKDLSKAVVQRCPLENFSQHPGL